MFGEGVVDDFVPKQFGAGFDVQCYAERLGCRLHLPALGVAVEEVQKKRARTVTRLAQPKYSCGRVHSAAERHQHLLFLCQVVPFAAFRKRPKIAC